MILVIIIAVFAVFLILSYVYEWEFTKKHWQEGKSYHKYDKIFGIPLGIVFFIIAIFIFVKTL